LALQAKPKGMVDVLMTSDEYIRSRMTEADVILVTPFKRKKNINDIFEKWAAEMSASLALLASPADLLQRATNYYGNHSNPGHVDFGAGKGAIPPIGVEGTLPDPSRDYHFK